MSRLTQIRAVSALLTLGVLLGVLTLFDIYGDVIMKRVLRLAAGAALFVAAACTMGCTSFGRALVPELKPIEAGLVFDMKCSDIAAKVAAAGPMEIPQFLALYSACEQMQSSQRVKIDPDAARKSIGVGSVIP